MDWRRNEFDIVVVVGRIYDGRGGWVGDCLVFRIFEVVVVGVVKVVIDVWDGIVGVVGVRDVKILLVVRVREWGW